MSVFSVFRTVSARIRSPMVALSIMFAAVVAVACSDNAVSPDSTLLHDFDPGPDDPGPLGTCLSDAQGDGSDNAHRVSGHYDVRNTPPLTCTVPGANRPISKARLDGFAALFNGLNGVHPADTSGTHYHIRFQ